jgi:hypothetical protein
MSMASAAMIAPAITTTSRGPAMPKITTVRVGYNVDSQILAQSDVVFEARNDRRSELVLRALRACTSGMWRPDLSRRLPATGSQGTVQMRLRPQDNGPYRAWCEENGLPYSTPVAHALWLYAITPDPKDLPF